MWLGGVGGCSSERVTLRYYTRLLLTYDKEGIANMQPFEPKVLQVRVIRVIIPGMIYYTVFKYISE